MRETGLEPQCFEDAVRMTALRIADLVISKQRDYGPQNILDFGEFGVLVRANDKVSRLKNLMKAGQPHHESVDDTWDDIVGYGLLGVMLREETFGLEMRGDPLEPDTP